MVDLPRPVLDVLFRVRQLIRMSRPLSSSRASKRRPTAVQATRSAPQQIRIIGGDWRRSRLPVPDIPGLRPTPDRVRETLFNWLSHLWDGRFDDKRVLDLFAGTGALGLEAASRGVAHVHLVETDSKAVALLRDTCARLKSQQVTIHHLPAQRFLETQTESFDLILLDPPFDSDWLERLLPRMDKHLDSNGLLYIESDAPPELPEQWEIVRENRAAGVYYGLLTPAAKV